jgi:hypothetical protein
VDRLAAADSRAGALAGGEVARLALLGTGRVAADTIGAEAALACCRGGGGAGGAVRLPHAGSAFANRLVATAAATAFGDGDAAAVAKLLVASAGYRRGATAAGSPGSNRSASRSPAGRCRSA